MSTAVMTERISDGWSGPRARSAGFFWLMTFVTGASALVVGGRFVVSGDAAATAANVLAHEPQYRLGIAANLIASVCYVAATLLVYELLKPVSRSVSLMAAFFSLIGCAMGGLSGGLQLAPLVILKGAQSSSGFTVEQLQTLAYTCLRVNTQVSSITFLFFGLHCLLVGWLILRSTFLPRMVGVLMVLAGVGWLTLSLSSLLSPPIARFLYPYIMLPGLVGEAVLSLWLLVAGVNVQRWKEQAGAAGESV